MRHKTYCSRLVPALLLALPLTFPAHAEELIPAQSAKVALGNLPMRAMWALESNDVKTLAKLAHPNGVRFSYRVEPDKQDKTLKPAQIRQLNQLGPQYWGWTYEQGAPRKEKWGDYRRRWLWGRDFSVGKISYNAFRQRGHTPNRLRDGYSDAIFVEAYVPESEGRVWASLWTIWKRDGKQWKLRGLANEYPGV